MIHTKLLIRRLAYVPWLLAAGLVLGWVGEAAAQTAITLELDKKKVREDVTAPYTITATAKVAADASADINVNLRLDANQTGLNDRFRINLATITIPKGKKEGTAALAFTPTNDKKRGVNYKNEAAATENLEIVILGSAGSAYTVNSTAQPAGSVKFTLVDDDRLSQNATLSFSPGDLSKDAGPTDVKVTATLDGSYSKNVESFTLVFDPTYDPDSDPTTFPNLSRDVHYTATLSKLSFPKKKVEGEGTMNIDPRGNNTADGYVALKASESVSFEGVDLNADGDFGDTYTLVTESGNHEGKLPKAELSKYGSTISEADLNTLDEDGDTYISEGELGIDLNGDGDNVDGQLRGKQDNWTTGDYTGAFLTKIKESDLRFPVNLTTNVFKIKIAPLAAGKGLTASPPMIRENDGTQTIDLKVTLTAKAAKNEVVTFAIGDGVGGTRDIDYTVSVSDLTILKDTDSGTATLTLTPVDNDGVNPNGGITFDVTATAGGVNQKTTIKIVDDETLTTNIALKVDTAEVTAGKTETIMVTGTIDGKPFDEDVTVTVVIDPSVDKAAQRDTDYLATVNHDLKIPAGSLSGSTTIDITAINGGDKIVGLKALKSPVKNDDEEDVVVGPTSVKLKNAPAVTVDTPGGLEFATVIDSDPYILGTVGEATEKVLSEATGGEGDKSYIISSNLANTGLSFDAATRTISGTPTAVGEEKIVYAVIDGEGNSLTQSFNIKVQAAPAPMIVVEEVEVGQNSVREDGAAATISIKATLAENGPAGTVEFTLEPSSAVRDVDYKASMSGSIAVEAGATSASTTLTLEPIDNDAEEGNKELTVQAAAGDDSATASITIADDETASTGITLSADPHEVSEDADETAVTITATLNGKVLDADAIVTVSIDSGSDAVRDLDYSARFANDDPKITIAKDSISGSVVLNLTPVEDGTDEGNESITLHGAIASLDDGTGSITLADAELTAKPEVDPLAFAEGAMIDDIEVTVNTALDAVTLPEATGGEGDISYAAAGLPTGVSFDDSTRTLSGSPTEEGTSEVTYTATAGDESVSLSFTITVNPPMVIDLSTLFGAAPAAAGKANPASEHGSELETRIQEKVGDDVSITINLPEDATATVAGLPDGLSYDSATRTISGTPTIAGEYIVAVTIGDQLLEFKAVIEALPVLGDLPAIGIAGQPYSQSISLPEGATLSGLPAGLTLVGNTISGTPVAADTTLVTVSAPGAVPDLFQLRLVVRGLGAPPAVMAQDYPNDNSGFVLLSWDLSADHDLIDGYRIFREMELDGGLVSIPWAMVDAVTAPGVDRGYAVVATIDLMATKWGVAAQLGREITDITSTKAVFAGAEDVNQPYELMAETLKASKEAARVGDGPVFATLLPEALAFAQGVVPNLKDVGGVQLSAITLTEEAVGPIDNIAPLSVPAVRAVDVLNDEGGRIEVTWTLSPSDRILQDVIAEATGPAAVQPVAGVHGYSIHRRAVGEEDFVMVGQVEAGVTSFVDETAAHGTRYIYEVRPFDSDNELSSDVEEAAIAVRNNVLDSEETPILGLFGGDSSVGLDDFFLFADHFLLTAEDVAFDAAFDLDGNGEIGFDDFFIFADPANFGRSTPAAGKRVPMFAGLNADARMYLDARTAMPSVGEDFVLDVSLADFAAVKGYGLQVQYDANRLDFVQALTEQPLGGSELATPQVLADEAGVLTVAAHGDVVSEGEVALSLVFRPTTEIEETVIEITNSQTYDDEFGFNSLALPAPVQVQTRPEVFALANNYPNPFNPATTIKYALPQAADVELTVYNVVGQVVRTLVAEHQSAGRYVVEWDATNDSGHNLSSGMYFYRLEAGGEFREVKKMLLLK